MDNLLKRFGFAPIGFQIFSLGDGNGFLAAADESMLRALLDGITATCIGGGRHLQCTVSDVIVHIRIHVLLLLQLYSPPTPITYVTRRWFIGFTVSSPH